jgi:lipopolysaccharide transport system ATP-binding protein
MHYLIARSINVSFPEHMEDSRSLRRAVLGLVGGGGPVRRRYRRVLRDISFKARPGDRIGLVGANGAGKTTLLRTLAGVYEPESGTIYRRGRVAPLLNTMLGMDPNLSGLDNIFLRGLHMGCTRAEMAAKAEEIIEFAELEDDILRPMRTYSSGMTARLAFAISTSVKANIYLLDEWIGAGDARFFDRAQARITQLIDDKAILVLGSHSDALISQWCNQVMVLDKGKQVMLTSVDVGLVVKNRILKTGS